MYFQLRKLILWPRTEARPRVVEFVPHKVNVISGASKTGKSAVIPIIDYCLGAGKCRIPVGVIRERCAWFGVVVDTLEGQKLFARREPGDQQSTGDMLVLEGIEVGIPDRIDERTHTVMMVKSILDRLSGLPALDFEPGSDSGYDARPSFRDLMAFTFQPQNIVANPDVLFFKADTTEHREKLKTIFPFVLGAVTAEVLQSRFELDRLNRAVRRKQAELQGLQSASAIWHKESAAWVQQAIEFGLLPVDQPVPADWSGMVDLLRPLTEADSRSAIPTLDGISASLRQLEELRVRETEAAVQLSEHRQRLNEITRFINSSEAYGGAMRVQRDRLSLAEWFRSLEPGGDELLAALGGGGQDRLAALCGALDEIEVRLRSQPELSESLQRELNRRQGAAEVVLTELNRIRRELAQLERESDEARAAENRYDQIERFLGRLEEALRLHDESDQSGSLREEISDLAVEIERLQEIISERGIERRLDNVIARLQNETSRLIPRLDAEWPDAPIRLIIPDLTIKVIRESRDDYLWEIGSGANWLAYHIALTVALQKHFLAEVNHPVPGLLVYDQPSQVYFPKRSASDPEDVESESPTLRDEDRDAVRKVFALLATEVGEADGRIQVIVLDHADDGVWGNLPNLNLIEEWRDGDALVPLSWLSSPE